MRAVFFTEEVQDIISIQGDQYHHLKNVLRVSLEDEILILNGKGLRAQGHITNISKKEIIISVEKNKQVEFEAGLELAVGIPKKENFEDICRVAVELGISKIYAVKCDYSQWRYQHSERLDKIIISACLQSNNPWIPEIVSVENVENLLKLDKTIIPMDLRMGKSPENIKIDEGILFVGPEAGFSEAERSLFEGLSCLNLKGPILRATSAVPAGIGYLQARLNN